MKWKTCYKQIYLDISPEEVLLLIMDSYFGQKWPFKHLNDGFVSYKLAAFHFRMLNYGFMSYVDYLWIIVMFLSAVWTLILTAPIHCKESMVSKWCNAKFLQICSDEESNYILDGLRVSKCSANVHFWVNYSFNRMFRDKRLFQILLWMQTTGLRQVPLDQSLAVKVHHHIKLSPLSG